MTVFLFIMLMQIIDMSITKQQIILTYAKRGIILLVSLMIQIIVEIATLEAKIANDTSINILNSFFMIYHLWVQSKP